MSGEELRVLAEAATPGPWIQEGANYDRPSRNVRAQHQDGWPLQGVAYNMGRTADAAFIAAANPTAVLALLDERDALRAQVERVRALADEWREVTRPPHETYVHRASVARQLRGALDSQ